MAQLITVTGTGEAALRKSLQTALAQISAELNRISSEINQVRELLAAIEARVEALEP